MSDLTFRNATERDLPRIVNIYNSTISSRMVTADTEPKTVDSRIPWFKKHNASNRPLWIVESPKGECLGWVSFEDFYGRPAYHHTAEISIYLSNDFRGKGYGRTILNACLDRAPSLGIKILLGFIFSHNKASIGLFERLNFERWGTLPDVASLDGIERTLLIYGKRVSG